MPEDSSTRTKRILVVDDDIDIRDILADVLKDEGFTVVCAANGKEAIRQLKSHAERFDLILLDLMMPEADGWDFRRMQADEPDHKDIPVILMSASSNAQEQVSALGARGCLRKPFRVDELLVAIEQHL